MTKRFKSKERKKGNKLAVMVLKKMSEFCGFGTHLDDSLRNQIIWGIEGHNIKKLMLCCEVDLNFKKSVKISVAIKRAINDVHQFQN